MKRKVLLVIVFAALACFPLNAQAQEEQRRTLEDLYAQIDVLEKQIELLRAKQEALAIENAALRDSRSPRRELIPREHQSYTTYRPSTVYAEPQVVPVLVQQPVYSPVFVEPFFAGSYCPYGFGGGAYFGHPGWGPGFGGINFNFGYGHHWHGHGRFCGW